MCGAVPPPAVSVLQRKASAAAPQSSPACPKRLLTGAVCLKVLLSPEKVRNLQPTSPRAPYGAPSHPRVPGWVGHADLGRPPALTAVVMAMEMEAHTVTRSHQDSHQPRAQARHRGPLSFPVPQTWLSVEQGSDHGPGHPLSHQHCHGNQEMPQ